MCPIPFLSSVVATGLILAVAPSPARGQTDRPPAISERQFTGGSAKVTVTGFTKIDEDIAINTKASYGDGEMTWLQFGVSGSEEPNAVITYGETGEIGITVGKGKLIATGGIIPGEKSQCSGKVQVTGTLVSGEYTCAEVTSYDAATGKMGKVDIKVRFTAKS
jgi:hypothetical protein